jgi:hypothetical protein
MVRMTTHGGQRVLDVINRLGVTGGIMLALSTCPAGHAFEEIVLRLEAKAWRSSARRSGSSWGAKWPPLGNAV